MRFGGRGQPVEPSAHKVKTGGCSAPVRITKYSLPVQNLLSPASGCLISTMTNDSGDSYVQFLWCCGKRRPLGEHYRAAEKRKVFLLFVGCRRAWLRQACWRGERKSKMLVHTGEQEKGTRDITGVKFY